MILTEFGLSTGQVSQRRDLAGDLPLFLVGARRVGPAGCCFLESAPLERLHALLELPLGRIQLGRRTQRESQRHRPRQHRKPLAHAVGLISANPWPGRAVSPPST